jgi:hypothetical protein
VVTQTLMFTQCAVPGYRMYVCFNQCSGSVTFWYGSGSRFCSFRQWLPGCQQKKVFFWFCLLVTFWRYIYIGLQRYKVIRCIALGWRFVDWPCRSQRLGRWQELAIGQVGPRTKGIIGKVPGPRVHPVDTRVFNPFPWKGRWEGTVSSPSHYTTPPPPPTLGQSGQEPTTPLHRDTSFPKKTVIWDWPRRKPRFGL